MFTTPLYINVDHAIYMSLPHTIYKNECLPHYILMNVYHTIYKWTYIALCIHECLPLYINVDHAIYIYEFLPHYTYINECLPQSIHMNVYHTHTPSGSQEEHHTHMTKRPEGLALVCDHYHGDHLAAKSHHELCRRHRPFDELSSVATTTLKTACQSQLDFSKKRVKRRKS